MTSLVRHKKPLRDPKKGENECSKLCDEKGNKMISDTGSQPNELEEQEAMCRLCLQRAQHNIFTDRDTKSDMAQDIMYLFDITVCRGDGLPQRVCRVCARVVRRAAALKRTAVLTQWRLRQEADVFSEEKCSVDIGKTAERLTAQDVDYLNYEPINGAQCSSDTNDTSPPHTMEEACEAKARGAETGSGKKRASAPRDNVVCEVCGKEFKNNFRLKRHHAVHSTELAYACDRCPYKARWATALLHHKRVHDGERPVQCPHCPARFVTPSNLASHRRTHFPPQFKCETCKRAFTNKQGLDNHTVSQHTNIKAHVCLACDKSFSTRRLLRRHELKSHGSAKRRAGSEPVYLQLQKLLSHSEPPDLAATH